MNQMLLSLIAKGLEAGARRAYKKDTAPQENQVGKILENISYLPDGKEEHLLDIIYPTRKAEQYPFIINIHGGGFSMNSKDRIYRNYGMRLAADRYAVINLNFTLAGDACYPVQMQDVLAALRYIKNNFYKYQLDLEQCYLSGDSYGAYMAMMTACILTNETLQKYYGHVPEIRIRAVAANCGMYDFTTFLCREIQFPMRRQIAEILFGSKEYEKLPVYQYSFVFLYMGPDFPPVYLMDTEYRSFAAEAYRLEEQLKKNKIRYQMHMFAKKEKLMHAFHIMSRFPQSRIVLQEIFAFFDGCQE